MKERPILFSAPMVRALLDDSKTQTRRIAKASTDGDGCECRDTDGWPMRDCSIDGIGEVRTASPYGQPGDRLWVRETFMDLLGTGIERRTGDPGRYAYRADTPLGSYGDAARKDYGLKWKPSIFMPRTASRITLEVTGVRVERLQDISTQDAKAEGIESQGNEFSGHAWRCYTDNAPGGVWFPEGEHTAPIRSYRSLWESINGADSWITNPWVWAIEFKRVQP